MAIVQSDLLEAAKKCELAKVVAVGSAPGSLSALEGALRDARGALSPKEEDYEHRKRLVVTTTEMVQGIFGEYTRLPNMEPFGSFIMDLFTASSDLDLSVDFNAGSISSFSRAEKIAILKRIARVLYSYQRQGRAYNVSPILTARVPIVKYVDRNSKVECDISVENKDGVLKSFIISQICLIDQRCQILCFLMKAWAKEQNINSSKHCTLNSLSIILLVIFHLQTRHPPILPPLSALLKGGADLTMFQEAICQFKNFGRSNNETISELFISLLNKLYSVESLWKQGLCASTYEGSWIFKKWNSGIACISVEDFTDREQNCARAVGGKQFKKIYLCIHRALSLLAHFMSGGVRVIRLKRLLFGFESTKAGDILGPVPKKEATKAGDILEPVPKKEAIKAGDILEPVPKKKVVKIVKKLVKKIIKKKVGPRVLQPVTSDENKTRSLEENKPQVLSVNADKAVSIVQGARKETGPSQVPNVAEPKAGDAPVPGTGLINHPRVSGSGPEATTSEQPATSCSVDWTLTTGNVHGDFKEVAISQTPATLGPKRSDPPASESVSPGKKIRPNPQPQGAVYIQHATQKKVKKVIKKLVKKKAGYEGSQPVRRIATLGNFSGVLKEAAPSQAPALSGPKRGNPPALETGSPGKKIRPNSQPQEAIYPPPLLRPHRPISPALPSNPARRRQHMSSMLPRNSTTPTIPPLVTPALSLPSAQIPGNYSDSYMPEYSMQNSLWSPSRHILQGLALQLRHELRHPLQTIRSQPEHLHGLRESIRLHGVHDPLQPAGSPPWYASHAFDARQGVHPGSGYDFMPSESRHVGSRYFRRL